MAGEEVQMTLSRSWPRERPARGGGWQGGPWGGNCGVAFWEKLEHVYSLRKSSSGHEGGRMESRRE